MVIFPKAKINIGLRVTSKRNDGFHNLETVFYPVCICDAIEFVVADRSATNDELKVSGSMTDIDPSRNLVIKAVAKIREIKRIPFLRLHLLKAIPTGAGLGGGSSDASAMLKSLNSYFGLGINCEELRKMSLELGSDCPFFIEGNPSLAKGRGEILSRVKPLPEGLFVALINPGISVSTREAYDNCSPGQPSSELEYLYNLDISEWKKVIINDFEKSVFIRYPVIAEIKNELYKMGAVYSSMSGSGSTVYGIFRSKPDIPDSLKDQVIYSGKI